MWKPFLEFEFTHHRLRLPRITEQLTDLSVIDRPRKLEFQKQFTAAATTINGKSGSKSHKSSTEE